MRVKALGLDHARTAEAEAALAAVPGGMCLRSPLRAERSREEEEFAVGEHAVYVKQQQFDLLGSGFAGIGHARIVAKRASGSRLQALGFWFTPVSLKRRAQLKART